MRGPNFSAPRRFLVHLATAALLTGAVVSLAWASVWRAGIARRDRGDRGEAAIRVISPALPRGGRAIEPTPPAARVAAPAAAHATGARPAGRSVRRRELVTVPAGSYLPLYTPGGRSDARVEVGKFELDALPVTRAEFARFLERHPEWRRSRVAPQLASGGYLAGWPGDLSYGTEQDGERPVTAVPRAAAAAFCSAEGKRLPTTDEWEYAAAAGRHQRDASADPTFKQELLDLYTRPRAQRPTRVGSVFRNVYGIWDLHGLVWEWTAGSQPQHHAMHVHAAKHDMGCAGSAAGASDSRNYASFLRYAFREAASTGGLSPALGFRCAR